MKTKVILLLKQAVTHDQIKEIIDAYYQIILYDNHLSNALRDARVRINKTNKAWNEENIVWEIYQLN